MRVKNTLLRLSTGVFCISGLIVTYLFLQHANLAGVIGIIAHEWVFVFNKVARFLLNDFLMIGVIYALFYERKYVVFACWVQVVEMVFILTPYLLLKVVFEAGNGPLVSFLHRLVLNPTVLLLLIPALFYQKNGRLRRPEGSKGF